MNDENKTLELRVGIFVLIGLIAIGIMAVQFGRVGQGLTKYYELKIVFPNASGLLKNSDVQLSGAVVGYVGGKPAIDEGRVGSVSVSIYIREHIKIPKGSTFQVGSSGMLGDKFVDILIPLDFDDTKFDPADPSQVYGNGDVVHGTKQGGFDELAKKAETAMVKLAENLDALKLAIGKLDTGLLSDENLENVRLAFANIKTTGENFAEASKGITEVVDGAKEAVATAKETLDSAKVTMATANDAAKDIRLAIDDARTAIASVQTILKTAQTGPGVIPMLLSNPEVAANLKDLIANIRRHGVLFYRDSARKGDDASDDRSQRRRGERSRRSLPRPAPGR